MPINSQQTLSDAEDSCSTLSDGVFLGKSRLLLCMAGLRLTWSIYESRREMPWHAHENTTLYLHVQGEHTDMSGSGEFRQPPFSVSLHPQGVAHRSRIGQGRMSGLNLSFTGAWLERFGIADQALGAFGVGAHPLLGRASLLLLIALQTPEALSSEACQEIESQVAEILSFFGPAGCREDAALPWLRRAEDLLRVTYRHPILLAQVAAEVSVHPVHLARTFRQRMGCTVLEFVHLLRLREAARLMLDGMPAALAAQETGFADQAHMIRSFRRHIGISPKSLQRLGTLLADPRC